MLEKAKLALRLTGTAYDAEVSRLIDSALRDMGILGINIDKDYDPLIERAVITYCRVSFGTPNDYDRLKASYDEQKAQLMTAKDYKRWCCCGTR